MRKPQMTLVWGISCCTAFLASASAQNLEWIKPSLLGGPAARCCAAMADDAAMKATLLFGGANYGTTFGDTWAFSRAGWTQLSPPVSPPAVSGPGMAYDPITKTVVLFGGYLSNISTD